MTGRRGRVLCLTSSFPRWEGDSTPAFVLHLAQDLQELGWQVDVLAPHAPGAALGETLGGVQVERFRYLWPASTQTLFYGSGALVNLRKNRFNAAKIPSLVIFECLAVARRLALRHYDLVHSHWILPQGFTVAVSAKPLRVPHVLTVHGGDIFALRSRLLAPFKRLALRLADVVTVNSNATRAAVLQVAPDLVAPRRIPMGASEELNTAQSLVAALRSRFRRGDGPLLAFVGRVVEEKGVADLIRAVSLLVDRLPNVTAMIIGEGRDRPEMQTLAKNLGIGDRVAFTGWVPSQEVPSHLAAADLFVGPSKRAPDGWIEGQGITFAEAMLARIPVIATRLGGIVDLVRHEETGLLVPEGAPQDIAAAVERLVRTPALACRISETASNLVRREYTRNASAAAFSEVYEELRTRRV